MSGIGQVFCFNCRHKKGERREEDEDNDKRNGTKFYCIGDTHKTHTQHTK